MLYSSEEDKVIKLVYWLTEHPKIRRILCDSDYEVEPEEFIEIMEMLEKNEFYEMIVVLLIKNSFNELIEQVMSRILVEKMGKEWERIGTEQLCRDIKAKVREEVKLREARGSKF